MHSFPCIAYAMDGVPCISYMETTKITLKPKDKQVLEEKLKDLLEFAQIHRLPCFVSFVTGNTEKGTTYRNLVYSAQTSQIQLTDDQIRKHLLIASGFEAVPPRESLDLDMGELLDKAEKGDGHDSL